MKKKLLHIVFALVIIFISVPVYGATTTKKKVATLPLEISGWIPYWRKATGTPEVIDHIALFSEISPFGYTVKLNGDLFDAMKIDEDPWPALVATAQAHKVKIIPTVMWSNASNMDTILRNPASRASHVKAVATMVKSHNFDGVDIDYEGKKAETKKYFSLFLRDMKKALGKKILSCTIEARTPLSSRFDTIPKDIQYSNDFSAINTYCDRVRIMTYDQGTVDLKLNRLETGPYAPIADPRWVEKVVNLAKQTIARKKIVIGVATYGYEYTIQRTTAGYIYKRETSFNPNYILPIMRQFNVIPKRNDAGELTLFYDPASSPLSIPVDPMSTSMLSLDTSFFAQSSVTVASTSAQNATTSSLSPTIHMLWWSDASAIKDKMNLAKKLGVRGIAIFKLDGGEDQELWNTLQSK